MYPVIPLTRCILSDLAIAAVPLRMNTLMEPGKIPAGIEVVRTCPKAQFKRAINVPLLIRSPIWGILEIITHNRIPINPRV